MFDAARNDSRRRWWPPDIRVRMDEREGTSPGFKFNDWEMRGVPLRIEIGPKDVAKGSVVLARRDRPGKEGKSFRAAGGLAGRGRRARSRKFRKRCWNRARAFRDAQYQRATELRRIQGGGRNRICLGFLVRQRATARRKSRKRPRPRCAAYLWRRAIVRGPASFAASARRKRASSAALISPANSQKATGKPKCRTSSGHRMKPS